MTDAANQPQSTQAVTVEDFMNRSFQNCLAKEVRYTGSVTKGILASFGMHSFVGGFLMGINPLLGLLSLAPAFIGVRAAIQSGQQFDELYEQSLDDPTLWREFVDPRVLEGTEDILKQDVEKLIEQGRKAAAPLPGKFQPLNQQIQSLLMGAIAANQSNLNSPNSKTAATESLTANSSRPLTTAALSSGLMANGFERLLQTAIASSVLLASLRGTGKTSLLQALFSEAMEGDIIGLDPKNSNSLGILEPYFIYAPPSEGEIYLTAVLAVRDEMRRRNRDRLQTKDCRPLWLVIDEYQTTRGNWKSQTQTTIKNALSEIINQGRERRVFAVLMGQSPLCGDIGFSGGERANMSILALGCHEQPLEQGGGGGWDSIERMLQSQHVIPSQATRDSLNAGLAELKPQVGKSGRILAGVNAVAQVPDLRKVEFRPLPHQVWHVEGVNDQVISEPASDDVPESSAPATSTAQEWQIPQLIEELINGKLPIRPIDLGKTAWAGRLSRKNLIKSRSSAAMAETAQYLTEIYEQFYLDDEGLLCLMAPYSNEGDDDE